MSGLCLAMGAEPTGVSIQTVLGLVGAVGATLASVIAALWRANNSRVDKTETRLSEDLAAERVARTESDKEVKSLIGKVGALEGRTEAYMEVKESISNIEKLSYEVLDSINNDVTPNS